VTTVLAPPMPASVRQAKVVAATTAPRPVTTVKGMRGMAAPTANREKEVRAATQATPRVDTNGSLTVPIPSLLAMPARIMAKAGGWSVKRQPQSHDLIIVQAQERDRVGVEPRMVEAAHGWTEAMVHERMQRAPNAAQVDDVASVRAELDHLAVERREAGQLRTDAAAHNHPHLATGLHQVGEATAGAPDGRTYSVERLPSFVVDDHR